MPVERQLGLVEEESRRRAAMWRGLGQAGGPEGLAPRVLRDLGMYGGAQGVWVDQSRTGSLVVGGSGVTVSVLHTGREFQNDLALDGLLYEYPRTRRAPGRDRSEIIATQAAGRLGLPVFVIAYPSPGSSQRDVRRSWVAGWDDELETFFLSFDPQPSSSLWIGTAQGRERFRLDRGTRGGDLRSQRLKFTAWCRYGIRCGVCGVRRKELLEAVLFKPWGEGGTDDPRNAVVLCANHARALEAGLFAIDPKGMRLRVARGLGRDTLALQKPTLQPLRNRPHSEALRWRWQRWPARRRAE